MTSAGGNIWRAAMQCLAGSVAIAFLTVVCVQLRFDLATTELLYLMVIVLLSLMGSFLVSTVLSLMAVGCLAYFFAPPSFSIRVADPREVVGILTFVATSAVVTHLVSRMRKSVGAQREQVNLLNLTHDSIVVRDSRDVITYWNRGAEEFYGWTAEEVIGKTTTHHLLQTVFPAPIEQINAELLRAGRWEGQLTHAKKDGTRVVVAIRWSLQRDEQRRPLGILELNNDITERQHAEDALRRQANLLEQTHDAIIVWEFPRTIIFWNRGAEQLYGFSREEAIGRTTHDLLKTEHPLQAATFEAALEREGDWKGELTHTARDGRTIVVESRHVLIREADGRRLVLETNHDITERKRAEEALRQAQADLTRVSRVTTMGELTAYTGVGLPAQRTDDIFKAFFTTKPHGTGMAPSISRSIVESHGGRLWAANNASRGAGFHIALPLGLEAQE